MMSGKTVVLESFPREFEYHFWTDLDRRFYVILMGSWITIFTIVLTLGSLRYDTAAMHARIRQAYLDQIRQFPGSLILDEAKTASDRDLLTQELPEVAAGGVTERQNKVSGGSASAKEKIDARRLSGAERLASRKLMEKEVAGVGVLGLLSSGGVGGAGDPVTDMLGEAGTGTADLEGIINGLTGVAVSGKQRTQTRLERGGSGRVTGSATVSDLISGISAAQSANIGRKGSIGIIIESARISGSGSGSVYRSSDEISARINSHNNAIEYCYKRELKLNPSLQGSIVVEFVIEHSGRVIQTSILASTFSNKAIEQCILSRIKGWRFRQIGRSEGNVSVRQKYIFG